MGNFQFEKKWRSESDLYIGEGKYTEMEGGEEWKLQERGRKVNDFDMTLIRDM